MKLRSVGISLIALVLVAAVAQAQTPSVGRASRLTGDQVSSAQAPGGPVRLELLPTSTWQQWDRARLARTGGTPEQYKHPCLISDPKFRETVGVEEEVQVA